MDLHHQCSSTAARRGDRRSNRPAPTLLNLAEIRRQLVRFAAMGSGWSRNRRVSARRASGRPTAMRRHQYIVSGHWNTLGLWILVCFGPAAGTPLAWGGHAPGVWLPVHGQAVDGRETRATMFWWVGRAARSQAAVVAGEAEGEPMDHEKCRPPVTGSYGVERPILGNTAVAQRARANRHTSPLGSKPPENYPSQIFSSIILLQLGFDPPKLCFTCWRKSAHTQRDDRLTRYLNAQFILRHKLTAWPGIWMRNSSLGIS
jgi:hypothetical protein